MSACFVVVAVDFVRFITAKAIDIILCFALSLSTLRTESYYKMQNQKAVDIGVGVAVPASVGMVADVAPCISMCMDAASLLPTDVGEDVDVSSLASSTVDSESVSHSAADSERTESETDQ